MAGSAVADPLAAILCGVRRSAGASLGIGLAVSAFAASAVFLQIQSSLNTVFGQPDHEERGIVRIVRQRLIAVAAALALALLVLVPVVAVAVVQYLGSILPEELAALRAILPFVVPLVSLVVLTMVVSLTYTTLTKAPVPWRAAVGGGSFTAVTGLVAALLVGTYLGRTTTTGTLGALGGVAVLLFFFNVMWSVYLFGAELTKVGWGSVVEDHPVGRAAVVTRPGSNVVVGFLVGLVIGAAILGRRRR